MRRFRLTKATVDAELKKPKGPRIVWDGEIPGFGLRIRALKPGLHGTRGTFVFACRVPGSRTMKWLTRGEYGRPYTADDARKWAKEKRQILDDGKDPGALIAGPASGIPTLKAYADPASDPKTPDARACRYLHLKATRTKPDPPKASTIAVDRGNLRRICIAHPAIAAKPLHRITPDDIKAIVNRDDHKPAGNRWLAVVRHLFNQAANDNGRTCPACSSARPARECVGAVADGFDIRTATDASGAAWRNPCDFVPQYTEKGRQPEISDGHIQKLLAILDRHMRPSTKEELKAARRKIQPRTAPRADEDDAPESVTFEHDPFVAGLIKLQLLTGARGSELRTAKKKGLTITEREAPEGKARAGILKLTDSKEGGGKTIFLAPDAVKVIDSLPVLAGSEYIFPGRGGKAPLEKTGVAHWWARHRAEAGLDAIPLGDGRTGPATLHDLRHNFAAVLLGEGASLAEVGELLGHRSEKTTKQYASLVHRVKELRAAKAASAITAKASA